MSNVEFQNIDAVATNCTRLVAELEELFEEGERLTAIVRAKLGSM